jgi:hypothetical protein
MAVGKVGRMKGGSMDKHCRKHAAIVKGRYGNRLFIRKKTLTCFQRKNYDRGECNAGPGNLRIPLGSTTLPFWKIMQTDWKLN